MENSSQIIQKIADKAILKYKENKIPPGQTIVEELKKHSDYNFDHIKRASEKANVGIVQEVILKTGEDKGRSFELANANEIAGELLIEHEKTSSLDFEVMGLKDLSNAFGKRASHKVSFDSGLYEPFKRPQEKNEEIENQKKAEYLKIAERKVIESIFDLDEELENLDLQIKKAMHNEKDLAGMVMIIKDEINSDSASLFCKSANKNGYKMTFEKISKLRPITKVPKGIINSLKKISKCKKTIKKVTDAIKRKKVTK